MKERWLLPFSGDLDLAALQTLIELARHHQAELVAVALLTTDRKHRRIRAERSMEAQDFLQGAYWAARRANVPLRQVEVLVSDVHASISSLWRKMRCTDIVLLTRQQHVLMLRPEERASLLEDRALPLVMIDLPPTCWQRFVHDLNLDERGSYEWGTHSGH